VGIDESLVPLVLFVLDLNDVGKSGRSIRTIEVFERGCLVGLDLKTATVDSSLRLGRETLVGGTDSRNDSR
jgi:hypothetical protein